MIDAEDLRYTALVNNGFSASLLFAAFIVRGETKKLRDCLDGTGADATDEQVPIARRHALANDVRKLGSNFNLVKIFFFFDYYRVVPLPPLLGSFVPSIWILSNRFFLQASSSDFQ